jgi:hypothetical protein
VGLWAGDTPVEVSSDVASPPSQPPLTLLGQPQDEYAKCERGDGLSGGGTDGARLPKKPTAATMTDKKKTTKESEPTHKILHETHQKSKGKTAAPSVGPSTSKSTETFEEKNLRTVFVGNVHIDCVKNKVSLKLLHSFI